MAPPPRVLAFNDEERDAELGKLVISAQNKALEAKGVFDIGISGGSQGPALAAALLHNKLVKWTKWRVWLVDERIVPIEDKDSNWGLFKTHILDKLPADSQPKGFYLSEKLLANYETVPHQEFAADYQQRLVAELGEKPSLDLALLGMGPDGHTCSLFPGHPLLKEEKLLVASLDDSPKPPPKRITLTKPALALADLIVFIASGASKVDALKRIFAQEDTSVPSKQVIDLAKNQVVFLTDDAALGK